MSKQREIRRIRLRRIQQERSRVFRRIPFVFGRQFCLLTLFTWSIGVLGGVVFALAYPSIVVGGGILIAYIILGVTAGLLMQWWSLAKFVQYNHRGVKLDFWNLYLRSMRSSAAKADKRRLTEICAEATLTYLQAEDAGFAESDSTLWALVEAHDRCRRLANSVPAPER